MKKYVRCKVCGFIMEEGNLKDVCPACGVPKTAFVEFKFNISEQRQKLLDLHAHPISVHFPEAIAVFLTGFWILSKITSGSISANLTTTNKTLALFFPLTVLLAFLAGIFDTKVRFKKFSPPYIKLKIYLGVSLLASSIATLIVFQNDKYNVMQILLALISLGISTVLGKLGGTLIDSQMPGK